MPTIRIRNEIRSRTTWITRRRTQARVRGTHAVQNLALAILLVLIFGIIARVRNQVKPARVAYFIQASASNSGQVARLIGALCDPTTEVPLVAVHLDASIEKNEVQRVISDSTTLCPRVHLVQVPREYVTYRGITLSLNYVAGATALLRCGVYFDYMVVLSGADYPTARAGLIASLLGYAAKRRLSFVEWKPRRQWRRFARGRLGRIFVDTALASAESGSYLMPPDEELGYPAAPPEWRNLAWPYVGFTVAKTSGWFVWHRELVEHLILGATPRRMYGAFALSDASDEHIYASIIWNNMYFRARAVNNNLRNIFFVAPNGSFALADDGISRKRQHPYFVDDVDENGELLFWDQLLENPSFFTRKVRPNGNVTNKIDTFMLQPGTHRTKYERKLTKAFHLLLRDHFIEYPNVATEMPEFETVFTTS